MTTLREAAQQALEALKNNAGEMRVEGAISILETALTQQAEPAQEPVAWKQGNLVTFNEDPYPALGGLFVQFWDGEEVAARVYANDLKTLRQRCAKVYTAPPQRKPLTEEEIYHATGHCGVSKYTAINIARVIEEASWEKNHG